MDKTLADIIYIIRKPWISSIFSYHSFGVLTIPQQCKSPGIESEMVKSGPKWTKSTLTSYWIGIFERDKMQRVPREKLHHIGTRIFI